MSNSVSKIILNHIDDSSSSVDDCLYLLISALKNGLESLGLEIHRIQIPFTQVGGFRHPIYCGIALTWDDINKYDDSHFILHENRPRENDLRESLTVEQIRQEPQLRKRLGPYFSVLNSEDYFYKQPLNE